MSIPPKYSSYGSVPTQSLVVFNQVKSTKRQEYIRFFHEFLSPALCSLVREQTCQARLLEPTVANDDGSYTYVLLVDPVYLDGDYTIETLFNAFYGEYQSRIYLQKWKDTLIRTNGEYFLVEK